MKEKILYWAIDTGIRMLKTFGQAAASVFGATGIISEVDWPLVLITGVSSAALCFFTNLASFPGFVPKESEEVEDEV